jgi:hypothetical protein
MQDEGRNVVKTCSCCEEILSLLGFNHNVKIVAGKSDILMV